MSTILSLGDAPLFAREAISVVRAVVWRRWHTSRCSQMTGRPRTADSRGKETSERAAAGPMDQFEGFVYLARLSLKTDRIRPRLSALRERAVRRVVWAGVIHVPLDSRFRRPGGGDACSIPGLFSTLSEFNGGRMERCDPMSSQGRCGCWGDRGY